MPNARAREESGQAAVELVALLPVLLLLGAVVWQFVLVGAAAWGSAHAARSAARAEVVGRDAAAAARSALPGFLERGLRVARRDGVVRVRVRVPVLLPVPRPFHLSASAGLGAPG